MSPLASLRDDPSLLERAQSMLAGLEAWLIGNRMPQPDGPDEERIARSMEEVRREIEDNIKVLRDVVSDLSPPPAEPCICGHHYHGGPDEGGHRDCPIHGVHADAARNAQREAVS